MIVKDVIEALNLRVAAGESGLHRQVDGGYVGDLLSCVMAGASQGSVWVTVQGHPNVVAVASLVGISGIIVTEGARIEAVTLEKANHEAIPILTTRQPSFEVVAGLARLGIEARPR